VTVLASAEVKVAKAVFVFPLISFTFTRFKARSWGLFFIGVKLLHTAWYKSSASNRSSEAAKSCQLSLRLIN
jgi:hypothetical protein